MLRVWRWVYVKKWEVCVVDCFYVDDVDDFRSFIFLLLVLGRVILIFLVIEYWINKKGCDVFFFILKILI